MTKYYICENCTNQQTDNKVCEVCQSNMAEVSKETYDALLLPVGVSSEEELMDYGPLEL